MSLHHRREVTDMRSAFTNDRPHTAPHPPNPAGQLAYRETSTASDQPSRLPPPPYHPSAPSERRPVVSNYNQHYDTLERYLDDRQFEESPRSSQETYASTVQSEEDLTEDGPDFDVPELPGRPCNDGSNVLESTPRDFSNLFPSQRRLMIRHDDTTIDGNMNLRVDTDVLIRGTQYDMTLFHLRMHDLKTRDFSFRRHCRDSGREVCHSARKAGTQKRPGFQRSLSNALHSIRPKSEHRSSTSPSLTRHDSGYGSIHSMDLDEASRRGSAERNASEQADESVNAIKLEFSNYAQVEVKRAGNNNTRYEFEYWGVHYSWKRVSRKVNGAKEVSFQLKKVGSDTPLAHIEPIAMTAQQVQEERAKGGWVTPCSMWITDDTILRSQKDVSDVVVAAGLIALVDDSIRARFLSKKEKQLLIPIPKVHLEVQHIGPKQLINEMFNRKDNPSTDRPRPVSSDTDSDWNHAGNRKSANRTF